MGVQLLDRSVGAGSAFSDSGFVTVRFDLKSGSWGEAFRQAPVFISFTGSKRGERHRCSYRS